MNVYSNTKPSLVSNKTLKNLGKKFKVAQTDQTHWNESVGNFYEDYIQPNLFALIVMGLLAIFLTIRYVLKMDDNKKKASVKTLARKIKYKNSYNNFDRDHFDNSSMSATNSSILSDVYDGSIYPEYMLKDELVYDGNNNLYTLENEYKKNLEYQDGTMSECMMREMYETKTSKFLFDEMARVVSGK
jgi:hypothetical protein